MCCLALLGIVCFGPMLLLAQSAPQFVWEGQVDGSVEVQVRGARVTIEVKEGSPVRLERRRLFDRLPDSRQSVTLDVLEARGSVRIIQHPKLENDYTASVLIEDLQDGAGFYSIELRWSTEQDSYAGGRRGGKRDRLMWNGRVDGEIIVRCRSGSCESETVTGRATERTKYRFTRNLPARAVRVSVDATDGRGDTRLLEQPSPANNYSAVVRIRNQQSGANQHSFVLSWERPIDAEGEGWITRRGLTWRGRVDDRVRVVVQGGQGHSERVSGETAIEERFEFEQPLPSRGSFTPVIRKVRGRGNVDIIEFPSNRNGFRFVFEVSDAGEGEDAYQVEISW